MSLLLLQNVGEQFMGIRRNRSVLADVGCLKRLLLVNEWVGVHLLDTSYACMAHTRSSMDHTCLWNTTRCIKLYVCQQIIVT